MILKNNLLEDQLWGEKLVELEVDLHGFGKIKITGDLSNFQRISEFMDVKKLIRKGSISRIKVKSNFLKRIVEIRSNGVMRVNEKDNLKVVRYLSDILERVL